MKMKINWRMIGVWAVVASAALTWQVKAGDPASDPLPFREVELQPSTKSRAGMSAGCSQPKRIVGMEVRNQAGKRLGRIKEIVCDLKTEQTSYAVLSTKPKGLFASGGKLLAVPLNALTPGADGKHLILSAEKSQLETAMGLGGTSDLR